MNWSLLLFVIIGAGILVVYDLVKNESYEAIKQNKWYYLLSVLVCGVLAYFIKEEIVQKLLLVMSVVGFARMFRGIKKISE